MEHPGPLLVPHLPAADVVTRPSSSRTGRTRRSRECSYRLSLKCPGLEPAPHRRAASLFSEGSQKSVRLALPRTHAPALESITPPLGESASCRESRNWHLVFSSWRVLPARRRPIPLTYLPRCHPGSRFSPAEGANTSSVSLVCLSTALGWSWKVGLSGASTLSSSRSRCRLLSSLRSVRTFGERLPMLASGRKGGL